MNRNYVIYEYFPVQNIFFLPLKSVNFKAIAYFKEPSHYAP